MRDGEAIPGEDRIRLEVSAEKVEKWLCITLLCLSAIHLVTWYLNFYTSLDIFTIFRVFDFDEETNIPTLFNTVLFAVAAILALITGGYNLRGRRRYAWHWMSLGIIFTVLAVDEFTSMHETLVEPVRGAFGIGGGVFYLAWVIPALFLCAIGALLMFRFVVQLPPVVRRLLVLAAVVYLMGAVGFEMLQGLLTTNHPDAYVVRRITTFLEEFLEMLGLIILIRGLLSYMIGRLPSLQLDIVP